MFLTSYGDLENIYIIHQQEHITEKMKKFREIVNICGLNKNSIKIMHFK